MVRIPRSFLFCSVFIGLLLIAEVQAGLSIVDSVWWWILSWDNPASHDFENSALLTPPKMDPIRYVRDHIIASASLLQVCILPQEGAAAPPSLSLSSRFIRSPPAA